MQMWCQNGRITAREVAQSSRREVSGLSVQVHTASIRAQFVFLSQSIFLTHLVTLSFKFWLRCELVTALMWQHDNMTSLALWGKWSYTIIQYNFMFKLLCGGSRRMLKQMIGGRRLKSSLWSNGCCFSAEECADAETGAVGLWHECLFVFVIPTIMTIMKSHKIPIWAC